MNGRTRSLNEFLVGEIITRIIQSWSAHRNHAYSRVLSLYSRYSRWQSKSMKNKQTRESVPIWAEKERSVNVNTRMVSLSSVIHLQGSVVSAIVNMHSFDLLSIPQYRRPRSEQDRGLGCSFRSTLHDTSPRGAIVDPMSTRDYGRFRFLSDFDSTVLLIDTAVGRV